MAERQRRSGHFIDRALMVGRATSTPLTTGSIRASCDDCELALSTRLVSPAK